MPKRRFGRISTAEAPVGSQQLLDDSSDTALDRRLHVVFSDIAEIKGLLRQVMAVLMISNEMEIEMNEDLRAEMDNMRTEVQETQGSVESAKALLSKISERLKNVADSNSDAAAMKAELRGYANQLNAMQEDLGAAIIANDPDRPSDTGGTPVGSAGGANLNE